MQFLDRTELRKLFEVAYKQDRRIHLLLVTMFWSGLRINEVLAIRGRDVCNSELHVKRLKRSRPTVHKLHLDADPVFDTTPLIELAMSNPDARPFDCSPQWVNRLLKRYATEAGIHPAKAHTRSVGKHSICMLLWQTLKDLNVVQDWGGHVATRSTPCYLRAE